MRNAGRVFIALMVLGTGARAEAPDTTTPGGGAAASEPSGTSTDLFVMFGSDIDRPGLLPRANYNIGIGHTFGFLKKDWFGDEVTFAYTYENAGSYGFLHTNFGEHTESAGLMKNFPLPATKVVTGYTWIQTGITSYTGNPRVENRLDGSLAVRYGERYLPVKACTVTEKPKTTPSMKSAKRPGSGRRRGSDWNQNFDLKKAPKIWQAAEAAGHRTAEEAV